MSAGLSPWSKGWFRAESGGELPSECSLEFRLGFDAYHSSQLRSVSSTVFPYAAVRVSPPRPVESPSDAYLRAKGLL